MCFSMYWTADSKFMYALSVLSMMICMGAFFVIFPALLVDVFDYANVGQMGSILLATKGLSSVMVLVYSKILEANLESQDDVYKWMLLIQGIGCVISFIILLGIFKEKAKSQLNEPFLMYKKTTFE